MTQVTFDCMLTDFRFESLKYSLVQRISFLNEAGKEQTVLTASHLPSQHCNIWNSQPYLNPISYLLTMFTLPCFGFWPKRRLGSLAEDDMEPYRERKDIDSRYVCGHA